MKTMEKGGTSKNRGFIPAMNIRGSGEHRDYGPLGVELKNNVKQAWWRKFVQENPLNAGRQRDA